MNIQFHEEAWEDYLHWLKTDKKVLKRINDLIKDIQRQPYGGLGKPEPLRHEFQGYWSRRITHEHRLIYRVEGGVTYIQQCRYHYRKR